MGQFLDGENMPKCIQGEIDYLNRFMFIKKIESIINNLPKQKLPGSYGFNGELYQTFKEEIILILYNLFQRIEAERVSPNSFYEARVTVIEKLKTLQENYKPIFLMNIGANVQENINRSNPKKHTIIYIIYHNQVGIIPSIQS